MAETQISTLEAFNNYARRHGLRVHLILDPIKGYYFARVTWPEGEAAGTSDEGIGRAIAKAIVDHEHVRGVLNDH